MIKAVDYRKKTEEELKQELVSLKKQMHADYENLLHKKAKNVKSIGSLRKSVARVLTVLNEKKFLNKD